MELVVLGSGTAVPSVTRGSPGYLVRAQQKTILMDGGSGTLTRLLSAGVTITELDYVFYTHYHPDHTGDLVPLLFALKNPEVERVKPLTIGGPRGFREFLGKLQGIYGSWIQPQGFELNLVELSIGANPFQGFTLVTALVEHIVDSLGFRVISEGGKGIAYSGDSGYCQALVEIGRDADLFVMECAFPDEAPCPGHLTPSEAGEIASLAGCKRLLLTHFYPICEGHDLAAACRKHYSGPILLAHDQLSIIL